jgi:hypothetical protein
VRFRTLFFAVLYCSEYMYFGFLGGGNVSRITEARHHGALLTYARVLLSSDSAVVAIEPPILELDLDRALAKLVYPWFERTCFCLVALLVQCEFKLYYTAHVRPRLCVVASIQKN